MNEQWIWTPIVLIFAGGSILDYLVWVMGYEWPLWLRNAVKKFCEE